MTFAVPNTASVLLPAARFDALISEVGQRVGWMRSHACPCTYGYTIANNRLATPGSAQRACQTCGGVGFYWDAPGSPFRAYISFVTMAVSPDEPGVTMNDTIGPVQMSEPSVTIPYRNPNLAADDPGQSTTAWTDASADDIFVGVDMTSRYTAILQVGGQTVLPFQQNLRVAPAGAVTIWDPVTSKVAFVQGYAVDGPSVTIAGYPDGTTYMVEFQAAAIWVAWKRAGGFAHIRPFGGGTVNEPRRFRLQALDPWLRQRGIQAPIKVLPATGHAVGIMVDVANASDAMET